jgi:capsular polysaccharide transport system permease protein
MHGIIGPEGAAHGAQDRSLRSELGRLARAYRHFLLLVVAPTLVVAFYYYAIASDQYQSQADFVVRQEGSPAGGDGLGQLFGMNFGVSAKNAEAYLVADYLLSHDAVARLRREDQLVERFRRPHVDWISRLWFASPTPEKLLAYYRDQVTVEQDIETGISHLRVHAFRPDDAYALSRKLLLLGEERINAINARSYRDRVSSSEQEFLKADADLQEAQKVLTAFRRNREDIDPEGSGKAQIGLVSELTASLVAARSRLRAMQGAISTSSPQYKALAAQVAALEAQVAGQADRLAGGGQSIASSLGGYESLVVRRENAARRYAAAATRYEQAKAEAARKQIYLVQIVDANRPVKSLFPERGKIVLTVFLSLSLAFGIGALLLAGLKEHRL